MVEASSTYQTIRKLTAGSDAEILLVRRATDGRTFAMKLAHPTKRSASAVRMEHKLLSDLHHPNILTVHDTVETKGRSGMVLEYFPGATLRSMMHSDHRRLVRHLGYVVEQCGDALSYLHERSIYHGDVKPENILIAPGGRVRLIDLSIATGGIWGWLTPGSLTGTPKYMAPELIRSKRPDAKTDLYALGVVCYEIIAGQPPFDAPSVGEVLERHVHTTPKPLRHFRRTIDSGVERLVMSAIAKAPADRPPECRSFGRRLSRALGSPLEIPERLGLS